MSRAPLTLRFDDLTIRRIFGAEDAESEDDERFREYFVRNRAYDDITARLPLRILVGHKGVGKSALLRRAYDEDLEAGRLAIFVQPDDIAHLLREHPQADINSLIEIWKKGIIQIVAQKAFEVFTDRPLKAFDDNVFQAAGRSVTKFLHSIFKEIKPDIADATAKAIFNNFEKDGQIFVYVDDVDRGWSARPQDISNISALINSLRDLSNKDHKFFCRVALRSDVYFLFRTSDESTDKIEQDVIRLTWDNDQILRLMAKRVSTYFGGILTEHQIESYRQKQLTETVFSKVIDPIFEGRGKWSNKPVQTVMLSLCRARPRDLIKLMHGAAKAAARRSSSKINTLDLLSVFPVYSEERLQDLFNEFRSEVPNIQDFILQFKPTKIQKNTAVNFLYTNDQIMTKIHHARQAAPVRFASGRQVSDKSVLTFLYKIDFLIARFDNDGGPSWRYFDQSRFLAYEHADFGNKWEIHPAYRWALQPNDVQNVIDSIALPT